MGIAAPTRPEVLVAGQVTSVRPRHTKADQRLFAYGVTVQQPTGAGIQLDYFVNDQFKDSDLPLVATEIAIWAQVNESSYGASLTPTRSVTVADLDALAAALV